MLHKALMYFLYSRLGQWLSMKITGGWCYIKPGDQRWKAGGVRDWAYRYEGDPEAAPDRGISRQRNYWFTRICVQMPHDSPSGYLAIGTHTGEWIACLGRFISPDEYVIFRAGHEAGVAMFIADTGLCDPARLKIISVVRWRQDRQDHCLPPEVETQIRKNGAFKIHFV